MIPRSGQLKDGTSWDNYKIKEVGWRAQAVTVHFPHDMLRARV